MPVLELTQLRLKQLAATHPTVLQSLSLVRAKLDTNSQFYHCIEDPSLIYVLGLWPTLSAHLDFLASPARDDILGPQENMLQFCWTVHMQLDHMSSLPLTSPVLAIQRLDVRGDCVDAFNQAAINRPHLLEIGHPSNLTYGWRCDAPTGSHEALVFTGWENALPHASFAVNQNSQGESGHAVITGQYEQILLHHATNLERKHA